MSAAGLKCKRCGLKLRCLDSRPGQRPGDQERLYRCPNCNEEYFSHAEFTASSFLYRLAAARSVSECRARCNEQASSEQNLAAEGQNSPSGDQTAPSDELVSEL